MLAIGRGIIVNLELAYKVTYNAHPSLSRQYPNS
jgi:hypothetical protein